MECNYSDAVHDHKVEVKLDAQRMRRLTWSDIIEQSVITGCSIDEILTDVGTNSFVPTQAGGSKMSLVRLMGTTT